MATLKLSLIFFSCLYALSVTATTTAATSTKTKTKIDTTFLRAQCNNHATFSLLCVNSLKSKAAIIGQDTEKLAVESLKVAHERALSAEAFVYGFSKKMKNLMSADLDAIGNCTEMVSGSVSQLTKSLSQLERLGTRGTRDFALKASNLNDGTNNALSGIQSCKDLMADHQNLHTDLRVSIKARMEYVSQVVSNSLALCNFFISG